MVLIVNKATESWTSDFTPTNLLLLAAANHSSVVTQRKQTMQMLYSWLYRICAAQGESLRAYTD